MILPIPPSVNHMYHNAYIKGRAMRVYTQKAKDWLQIATLEAKKQIAKTYSEKVAIEIVFYFPDNRRRDTHNTLKILCDMLEIAGLVTDDRYLLPRIIDYQIDRKRPRIEINIKEV